MAEWMHTIEAGRNVWTLNISGVQAVVEIRGEPDDPQEERYALYALDFESNTRHLFDPMYAELAEAKAAGERLAKEATKEYGQ